MKSPGEISLLFLGDCVGPMGRKALAKGLPLLQDRYSSDFTIVNCENATHGRGCSQKHYEELLKSGVDCLTSGNHFYDSKDVFRSEFDFSRLVRPYNLGPKAPLKGTRTFKVGPYTLRITNLLGRVEIRGAQSNPFTDMDDLLKTAKEDFHLVDFHAEATGEKRCLAEYLDGRVSIVVGTHTHVQTNDARILNKGTGFISDAGMCGAVDSCLGMDKKNAVIKAAYGLPLPFETPEAGEAQIQGIHAVLRKGFKGVLIEPVSLNVKVV